MPDYYNKENGLLWLGGQKGPPDGPYKRRIDDWEGSELSYDDDYGGHGPLPPYAEPAGEDTGNNGLLIGIGLMLLLVVVYLISKS